MYTVLIIDDSASMRRILKDMINSTDEFEVVAVANDAYEAREKIKEYTGAVELFGANKKKIEETMEIELF